MAHIAIGARAFARPALGQTRHLHPTGVWASAAIGPTVPSEFGITATAGFRSHRLVLRGRYAAAAEFLGDWDEDVGVLLGMAVSPESQRVQLPLSAGVGRVTGGRGCVLCGTQPITPAAGFLFGAEGRVALTGFMGVTT
jgi:hypothetical protein